MLVQADDVVYVELRCAFDLDWYDIFDINIPAVQAHLRGYGGHAHWHTQDDMDRCFPPILRAWEHTVLALRWANPADPHRFLDCTGMGPGGWRTTCGEMIRKLRRIRQRLLLRREISAHTTGSSPCCRENW